MKNIFLKTNFSVKGTKEELIKLESLFIKAWVDSDEIWNDNNRNYPGFFWIVCIKGKSFAYHNHDCSSVCIKKRTSLSYSYVRKQLLKIIKDEIKKIK